MSDYLGVQHWACGQVSVVLVCISLCVPAFAVRGRFNAYGQLPLLQWLSSTPLFVTATYHQLANPSAIAVANDAPNNAIQCKAIQRHKL